MPLIFTAFDVVIQYCRAVLFLEDLSAILPPGMQVTRSGRCPIVLHMSRESKYVSMGQTKLTDVNLKLFRFLLPASRNLICELSCEDQLGQRHS
jgi:hypothetical protein